MTKLRSLLYVLALALFVGACANPLTKNINVDSQASAGADFSALKTYQWLAAAQILNDPDGQWEPRGFDADAEIRFLIDRELRKRGFTVVESNPDVFVAYVGGVDMDSMDWKVDPQTKLQVLSNQPEGALAVVLLDVNTGDPIWGAIASDNVEGQQNADDARTRLDYAVTQMFKRLPSS
jgi:hypothetical protein